MIFFCFVSFQAKQSLKRGLVISPVLNSFVCAYMGYGYKDRIWEEGGGGGGGVKGEEILRIIIRNILIII